MNEAPKLTQFQQAIGCSFFLLIALATFGLLSEERFFIALGVIMVLGIVTYKES